ncbi:MAG: hypothetical protein P1P89_11345 [Desulfobacterales bacterium]|nr:hypothetical protein [Desulfobacterales bacterium]
MTERDSGIRFIPGSTDILIVAPHGPVIDGEYQNDVRTGVIAAEVQRELGCTAVINDRFFKPKGDITKSFEKYHLDLFRIDHAGKVSAYFDRIAETVKNSLKTVIVWVHGIADDKAVSHGREHIDQGLFAGRPERIDAFIGYGQGADPKTGETRDRPTARQETVETFRDQLTAGGMTALITRKEGANYRGRDSKRFNQWFVRQGYGFDQAESIQLEIKEQGFRDSEENAVKSAGIIAKALLALLRQKIEDAAPVKKFCISQGRQIPYERELLKVFQGQI